jgi:1-aminocyclopropane-1-carboxylate deaminase
MHKLLDIAEPAIEAIHCDLLKARGVVLNVLRLDRIHPSIHGNKWFKLKANIDRIRQSGARQVVSFGGAYSNHIYALAAAGKLLDFDTIGFIRVEIVEPLNPVLAFARDAGMRLISISRSDYRRKSEADFQRQLLADFGDCYVLPEGGSNLLAVKGCEEIVDFLRWGTGIDKTDAERGMAASSEYGSAVWREQRCGQRIVALSCGTGATVAGIISGLNRRSAEAMPRVIGVSVLKAEDYIAKQVKYWLEQLAAESAGNSRKRSSCEWCISVQYHCGGYAKVSPQLTDFMAEFASYSHIPIEPVYTAKLFLALFEMIRDGEIPAGSEILAIHTGGVVTAQP